MTAASLDEEEDMDLSEEGEVGTAREGDDDPKEGDEDLQPPGEDPGAKQSNGGGGKKRKKRTSGQVRDDGEELAQKAQVSLVTMLYRTCLMADNELLTSSHRCGKTSLIPSEPSGRRTWRTRRRRSSCCKLRCRCRT